MRFGSVCSGIEAASQAWLPLGWEPVFYSEIDPFASALLAHRHPDVPNLGDMTNYEDWKNYSIDALVGGTPCQSFSVAGLREGIRDPRGNLALVFLGIVDRLRPRWVLWENVPGVHSSWTDEAVRAPTEAEADLLRARGLDPGGYEHAEQSSDFDQFLAGLAQLGYGVATAVLDAQYFGLAQRRERIFVVGHSRGSWQRAAAVLLDGESLRGNPPPRRTAGQRAAPTIEARAGAGGAGWGTDFMTGGGLAEVSPTLRSAPESGPGGSGVQGDLSYTLPSDTPPCVGAPVASSAPGSVAHTLTGRGLESPDETQTTLLGMEYGVRRLTPVECERLQGFPDGYTQVPYNGKPAAAGPRYRAIGNSMPVPVIRWIGERMQMVDAI